MRLKGIGDDGFERIAGKQAQAEENPFAELQQLIQAAAEKAAELMQSEGGQTRTNPYNLVEYDPIEDIVSSLSKINRDIEKELHERYLQNSYGEPYGMHGNVQLARDDVYPNIEVSTVWLGDKRWYQTMVFGGPLNGRDISASTDEEALQNHEEMVRKVREAGDGPKVNPYTTYDDDDDDEYLTNPEIGLNEEEY